MAADIQDVWRDEDGAPSPSQELTDWWLDAPREQLDGTYPSDHREYLQELYAKISSLQADGRRLANRWPSRTTTTSSSSR